MLSSLVLAASLNAGAELPACSSVAQCNRLGSDALRGGQHEVAMRYFEQQIDLAETALKQASDDDQSRLQHAREIAVNNAALAALGVGECQRARAWLEAADTTHKASIANRKALLARCAGKLDAIEHTGEFRQYVGHGAWNTISVRATGDETLQFSAFWMRIGQGPLQTLGAAAIGDIEQAYLHVEGDRGRGRFAGIDPDVTCELQVQWLAGALEVSHTADAACRLGGAGAELHGRYWRVGDVVEVDGAPE